MTVPRIDGKPLTSSRILDAVAEDLSKIKSEDRLTWVEVGEVLGVSDDQAAKYADASASMNIVTYTRGKLAWNGRFTGKLDRLIQQASGELDGHHALTTLLDLCAEISRMLEDGEIKNDEIHKARKRLEDGRAVIDRMLGKLTLRSVTA